MQSKVPTPSSDGVGAAPPTPALVKGRLYAERFAVGSVYSAFLFGTGSLA